MLPRTLIHQSTPKLTNNLISMILFSTDVKQSLTKLTENRCKNNVLNNKPNTLISHVLNYCIAYCLK